MHGNKFSKGDVVFLQDMRPVEVKVLISMGNSDQVFAICAMLIERRSGVYFDGDLAPVPGVNLSASAVWCRTADGGIVPLMPGQLNW